MQSAEGWHPSKGVLSASFIMVVTLIHYSTVCMFEYLIFDEVFAKYPSVIKVSFLVKSLNLNESTSIHVL